MYSAKINGARTTFGTSGLLYLNNKLMYDRTTNSLWNSFLGEPVIGPLADSGIKLDLFPAILTTWEEWLAQTPDTTVLSTDTGIYPPQNYKAESNESSFYYDYRARADTMFPQWIRDPSLSPKDEVLGLSLDGAHKAYAVKALQQERVVNDTIGETDLVVIGSSKSTGTAAYRRDGRRFALPADDASAGGLPFSLVDAEGAEWLVRDEFLESAKDPSQKLPRLDSRQSFWFGWYAFHPDTLLYGADLGG